MTIKYIYEVRLQLNEPLGHRTLARSLADNLIDAGFLEDGEAIIVEPYRFASVRGRAVELDYD